METIRKLTDIDPQYLPVVEKVFGQRLDTMANAVLVLRTVDFPPYNGPSDADELPPWCNVLEGMSERDRDEFRAVIDTPVVLAHSK